MDGKSETWRDRADNALSLIAKTHQYITSDMVVAHLEQFGLGLDNYSVLGGVFKRAAKAGIIEKHDLQRGKSNAVRTVWLSKIYESKDDLKLVHRHEK